MQADHILDLSGLACPMPLLKTRQKLTQLADGERLLVISTDSGSKRDIPAYLKMSAHTLEQMSEAPDGGVFHFLIVRSSKSAGC